MIKKNSQLRDVNTSIIIFVPLWVLCIRALERLNLDDPKENKLLICLLTAQNQSNNYL